MRRKEFEVTDRGHILGIIASCPLCRIGLRDGDGAYVVPMNFGFEEIDGKLRIYFHSAPEGHKLDLLRQSPRVCIEMDIWHSRQEREATGNPLHYQSVIATGQISFVTDLEEKRRGLALVHEHTLGTPGKMLSDEQVARICVLKFAEDELFCKEH